MHLITYFTQPPNLYIGIVAGLLLTIVIIIDSRFKRKTIWEEKKKKTKG